jgi:hypothetical protein
MMIQRIQSVYLFLASLFYFLYWFFGLKWYEEGYSILINFEFLLVLSKDLLSFLDLFLSVTSFIPLLISTICLLTLFLFKYRLTQIKLTKLSFYLSLFMSIYTVVYFKFTLNGLIEIMPSRIFEILLFAAIVNPFICSYLIYASLKSINRDQDLVTSIDRIR